MKMKRLLILLLWPSFLFGQSLAVQKNHCTNVASCALKNPVAVGDSIFVVSNDGQKPTDAQGDKFVCLTVQGWYGDSAYFCYALAPAGGSTTVQFSAAVTDIGLFEFSAVQSFDQQSKESVLCCYPTVTVGPIATSAQNELLFAITQFDAWPGARATTTVEASPGWTMDDTGTSFAMQERQVTPGNYSATIPQGPASGTVIFAFVSGPPPPFVFVLQNCPASGATCTFTFPMQAPPSCGASDGTCSLQIQVCDTSVSPANCLTLSSRGTVNILKNVSLPTTQTQTIVVVKATSP